MKNSLLIAIKVLILVSYCQLGLTQIDDTSIPGQDFLSMESFLVGYDDEDNYQISGGFGLNYTFGFPRESANDPYWGIDIPLRFYFFSEGEDNSTLNSISSSILFRGNFPITSSNSQWYFFSGLGPEFYTTFDDNSSNSYLGQIQVGVMRINGDSFLSTLQLGISFSNNFSTDSDHHKYMNTVFFRFNLW